MSQTPHYSNRFAKTTENNYNIGLTPTGKTNLYKKIINSQIPLDNDERGWQTTQTLYVSIWHHLCQHGANNNKFKDVYFL